MMAKKCWNSNIIIWMTFKLDDQSGRRIRISEVRWRQNFPKLGPNNCIVSICLFYSVLFLLFTFFYLLTFSLGIVLFKLLTILMFVPEAEFKGNMMDSISICRKKITGDVPNVTKVYSRDKTDIRHVKNFAQALVLAASADAETK